MPAETPGRCEECGTPQVLGVEYVGDHVLHDVDASTVTVATDWCPNPACPSNGRPRGFKRLSPNEYRCVACDELVVAFIERVFAHRQTHEA